MVTRSGTALFPDMRGTGLGADAGCSRAEKKRQADRLAQQKHRKRQRDYIAQLEEQLQAIRDGGQSQVAKLAHENGQLREEISYLHGLFDQLQQVIHLRTKGPAPVNSIGQEQHPGGSPNTDGAHNPPGQDLDDIIVVQPEPECPETNEMNTCTPKAVHDNQRDSGSPPSTTASPVQLDPPVSCTVATDAEIIVAEDMGTLPEIDFSIADEPPRDIISEEDLWNVESGATHVLDSVTNWWLDPHQTDADQSTSGHHHHPLTQQITLEPPFESNELDNAEPEQPCETIESPATQLHRLMTDEMFRNFSRTVRFQLSPQSFPSYHPHARLPSCISPPPPRDSEMHRILNVARSEIHKIGPPMFVDFVLDNTGNQLSCELKTFTEPMKRMKKSSEYLAAYWILYLLFRWQATLDEQSYHALPSWLRPTPVQLEIQHHAVLDQVPWPDLRDELIQMSVTDMDQTYEVLQDIGRHLIVDLGISKPASHMTLGMDTAQLCRNILDLSRWRLHKEFFVKYSQWWWLDARS